MDLLKELFQKEFTKRLLVLGVLIMVFYLGRSMLNLFLLTFLFTYLIYSLHKFLYEKVSKFVRINETVFIAIIYILLIGFFVIMICNFAPSIINETIEVINDILNFKINYYNSNIGKYIDPIFQQVDIKSYAKDGTSLLLKFATSIGKGSFNVFISLVLSMFFMFEKNTISKFMKKFENSKVAGIYSYIKIFGENFTNSFGKVIQTQIIIAFVNTVLSVIALSFMRFPQVAGLALMIFILGLIPVAGTIISLVPLSIVAYQVGGFIQIIYVLIMIVLLHSLESYVLNPRLMSAKTKLPVFFTFVVLLISEHFFGTWGLLIGIPLFMFFLDLLNVNTPSSKAKVLNKRNIE